MSRTLGLLASIAIGLAGCARDEPRHDGRTLASWRASLDSPAAGERRRACLAVAAMGREGAPAVPQLVALLGDTDVAAAAGTALVAVGPDAIAPLERRLAVDVPVLERLYAAHALVQLVPAHDLARSVLVEAFTTVREGPLAERAQGLVVSLGPVMAARVAALVEDPYVPLRVRALEVLGAMGPRARSATAVVLAQLESPEPAVRLAAVEALGRMGPAGAVAGPLRQAARDPDARVAGAASDALRRLGSR